MDHNRQVHILPRSHTDDHEAAKVSLLKIQFKNGSLTNYFDFYSWKGRITTHPHLDYLLWKALLILIMPTITILIDENKKLIFNILALKICMTNTYLCTTTITCDLSMVFLVEFLYVPHHPINVSTLVSPYILSLYVNWFSSQKWL